VDGACIRLWLDVSICVSCLLLVAHRGESYSDQSGCQEKS
jgi:hypothetical protein